MDIVYILLSLLIGFLLLGLLFGTTIVLSNKTKMSSSFCMAIFSVIPTVIMLLATDTNIFKFEYLFDYLSWIILISTDVIVIALIVLKSSKEHLSYKEIFLSGLDGVMMEIPQRMFMQTLVLLLLGYWNVNNAEILCILVNSMIWCLGIVAQAVIMNQKINRHLLIDILSSFIFSIGMGYVFIRTELIIFPMLGHFIERVSSRTIINVSE